MYKHTPSFTEEKRAVINLMRAATITPDMYRENRTRPIIAQFLKRRVVSSRLKRCGLFRSGSIKRDRINILHFFQFHLKPLETRDGYPRYSNQISSERFRLLSHAANGLHCYNSEGGPQLRGPGTRDSKRSNILRERHVKRLFRAVPPNCPPGE